MHKELLIQAFEKVRGELIKERGVTPSDTQCAKELSVIIGKTFSYGEKSLRIRYKKAINNPEEDIEIIQPQVLLALAIYLGYDDYIDFVYKNNGKENKKETDDGGVLILSPKEAKAQKQKKDKQFKKRYKVLITLTLLAVIGYLSYIYFNRQCWMEWQEDHYEEVSFSAEKLKEGILKLCKEDRIKSFKQIEPDCETKFFNNDGNVGVWYGKNIAKELEYFTDYGLHPETGKTLKPITQYMIDKYICL